MSSVLTVPDTIRQSANLLGSKVRVQGVLVITSSHCHLSPSRALRNNVSESIAIGPGIRSVLDEKTRGAWFLVGGDAYYLCDAEVCGTLTATISVPYHMQFTDIVCIVLIDRKRGRRAELALDQV